VPVAADEDAYHQLVSALIARDTYGILDMAARGRLVFVEPAAEARVLEYASDFWAPIRD
jgi:hypothetical protein